MEMKHEEMHAAALQINVHSGTRERESGLPDQPQKLLTLLIMMSMPDFRSRHLSPILRQHS